MSRQTVQRTIVCCWVDAPEARFFHLGKPGAELVAQTPKQPEHEVAVGGCITHNLSGGQSTFLLQEGFEYVHRITDRARNDQAAQARKLVRGIVEIGHASSLSKIVRAGAGI